MNWEIVTKAKKSGGLAKLVWDIKQNHKRQISTPISQNVTTSKHIRGRVPR